MYLELARLSCWYKMMNDTAIRTTKIKVRVRVQCCFTYTGTERTVRDEEPRTSSSTCTQLLSFGEMENDLYVSVRWAPRDEPASFAVPRLQWCTTLDGMYNISHKDNWLNLANNYRQLATDSSSNHFTQTCTRRDGVSMANDQSLSFLSSPSNFQCDLLLIFNRKCKHSKMLG